MEFVAADGIKITVARFKRNFQETLHAVHMQKSAGSFPLYELINGGDVVDCSRFIVYLHYRHKARARRHKLRKAGNIHAALLIHTGFNYVVFGGKPFHHLVNGRMLHRAYHKPALSAHRAKGPVDRHVVAFRAA